MPLQAVIVNADDLGLDSATNAGIFWAFEQGLISSTTVMANMPSFEEAAKEIKARGLVGRIGVHLNLVEGRPLTKSILSCDRFCTPDGMFHGELRGKGKWFQMTSLEVDAVWEELAAQVGACRRLLGEPTHLDSHCHFHYSWSIGRLVAKLASSEKIMAVRLNINFHGSRRASRRLIRYAYNLRLYLAGLTRVHYFTTGKEIGSLERLNGIAEVMVHPKMVAGDRVIDAEMGVELSSVLDLLKPIKLISYKDRLSHSGKCLPAF